MVREFLDSLEMAVWSYDVAQDRITVSPGLQALYGYEQEDFDADPFLWRKLTVSEDQHIVADHLRKIHSGIGGTFEHRIVRKSGEIRWLQCMATPVMDGEGCVRKVYGINHDITDKKSMQASLEREREQINELLDSTDVAVWSYNCARGEFDYITNAVQRITGYPLDRFQDLKSWHEIVYPDDARHYGAEFEKLKKSKRGAIEYRIVRADGQLRWVHVKVVLIPGDTMDGGRYEGLMLDVTDRKSMEDALKRSEQKYKSLFDHHPDSIVELDPSGNIRAMNRSALDTLGVSGMDEGIFRYPEFMSEEGINKATAHYRSTLNGEAQRFELATLHSEGHFADWDVRMIPIIVNGEVDGIFMIGNEITARVKAEKSLAASEAMHRVITDNMQDFISVIDLDGRFLYASPSYAKRLGRDPHSLISTSAFELIIPEDREFAACSISQILLYNGDLQARIRCIHANGSLLHLEWIGSPVRDDAGRIVSIVVVGRDITEQVRVENKLIESEKRYRRLIELSPVPIVSHKDGIVTYINQAGLKLFGADGTDGPGGMIGRPALDVVVPQQTGIAISRMEQSKSSKFVGPMEYRLIRLDGRTIDVELTSIYDDETESNLVVVHDVTEPKKMQAALRESEERYRRMVELSPMAIVVYKGNRITYANPTSLRIVGASNLEEILDLDPISFVHPRYRELVRGRMVQTLREGHSPPAEYELIGLDGRIVDASVTAIYDAVSETVLLVFMDVTARKQAERALMESEETNSRLVQLFPEAIVLHSDYRFEYVNPAACQLFGIAEHEPPNLDVLVCIHPDDREKACIRLNKVYDEGYTSPLVEQRIVRLDGSHVPVEVISAPISYRGKKAAISVFRDITERTRAEELRGLAERRLIESRDRYFFLQASLDRFSNDLFGHVDVTELERRLVQEVRTVLQADLVSLVETDENDGIRVINGSVLREEAQAVLRERSRASQSICEMMAYPGGYLLKIVEIRGHSYWLCIGEMPPSLSQMPTRIWLETICRYVSVLYDNFRVIEDLTRELKESTKQEPAPSWLLRLLFKLNEHERKRLSQDLHDAALQEQIIWYRKLDQLMANPAVSDELRVDMERIAQGLLDVIYQIRITCIDLRPPMLKEEGLVASLESLFEFTQMRTDYAIRFQTNEFRAELNEEQSIGLYRIVQELLANATKHSNAAKVSFSLSQPANWVQLVYEDDGIGMDMKKVEDTFVSMGMYGMRERVHSLNGKIVFRSKPNEGLTIYIRIPMSKQKEADRRD
ncbi:PAS domain S-box protein [Cohnella candidum]|uniref:histidine kinase n=1 Tax=Cohnella candidum TaxID=2674991 RepID=A0A3G3JVH3_9BACL|nr:PAS domain S-box protein [Cohnella candidum]AYQ72235.1 PAS domain S-box protein [Cohnella candidum]